MNNMTATDFESIVGKIESSLRDGHFQSSLLDMVHLNSRKMNRHQIQIAAQLARRSHQWHLIIKWLKPIVYPELLGTPPATSGEIMDYAFALVRAGALADARSLLLANRLEDHPYAHFILAHADLAQWNYAGAAAHLETFLSSNWGSSYEKDVARVNLAACRVNSATVTACEDLNTLAKEMAEKKEYLLLGNVLETATQDHIRRRDFTGARQVLIQARGLLANQFGQESFIEKWTVVIEALENRSVRNLDDYRQVVLPTGQWEVLRDLDFFRATIEPSHPMASWVYFGTPYPAFRERLDNLHQFPEECWVSRSSEPGQSLDPWFLDPEISDLVNRLIVFLLKDFYRPSKVAEIYCALFPAEGFHGKTSANRIHKIVQRARTWLTAKQAPIRIEEIRGDYSIRISEQTSILCRRRELNIDKTGFFFERLNPRMLQLKTIKEICEALQLTDSQARLMLLTGEQAGFVERSGAGRNTKYSITSRQTP